MTRLKTLLLCCGFILALTVESFTLSHAAEDIPDVHTPPKFRLRISGATGFLQNGGDLSLYFRSETDYYQWVDSLPSFSAAHNYSFSKTIPYFSADLSFYIKPAFGIRVGAGYMSKSWKPDGTYSLTDESTLSNTEFMYKQVFSIDTFPLSFSGFYSVPLGKVALQIQAGVDYYLGRMSITNSAMIDMQGAGGFSSSFEETLEYRLGDLGYHAGLGLDWDLSTSIGLSIEAEYRTVKFDDLSGEYSWSLVEPGQKENGLDSGTGQDYRVWYGTENVAGKDFAAMELSDAKPESLTAARLFEINLDGVYFGLGLYFRF